MYYFLRKETGEIEQNRSGQVLRTRVYERPSAIVQESISTTGEVGFVRTCWQLEAAACWQGYSGQKYIYKNRIDQSKSPLKMSTKGTP